MTTELRARPVLPRWEVEWKLVDLFCEQFGEDRTRVSPVSRLSDFPFDSLDIVEFVIAIEEAFGLHVPDRAAEQAFTAKHTFRDWAAVIVEHWRDWPEPPPPHGWGRRPPATPEASAPVPFIQATGPLSSADDGGPLYEPLAPNREDHPQFRRRTDGMRCVAVPGAGAVGAFVIDAEPVSCAAFAHFLNAVEPLPAEAAREWCGVAETDRRRRHFPLRRGWSGRWRPIRGAERWPMILVSWYGASAYALWANRRDWRQYRADGTIPEALRARRPPGDDAENCLPSEAQWEYAARGPAGAAPAAGMPPQLARHRPHADYALESLPLAPVNEPRGLSPFGLHHIVGNVWQWCRDWYADGGAPVGPTGLRSERGGSWVGPERLANLTYRRGRLPEMRGRCLGFRCVGATADLPE
jgi:acyl carrier protein